MPSCSYSIFRRILLAKSAFIQERFSRLGDEAKARIAKLEREVVALKHH
jgi:hypothetical protein